MSDPSLRKSSFLLLLVCSIAGAALSGYLAIAYYAAQAGHWMSSPACQAGGTFDCHLVSLSKYAVVGGLPLAVWGAALYAIWIILSIVGLVSERRYQIAAVRLMAVCAVIAVLCDAVLAWIMITRIGALCVWCIGTYVVNIAVLLLSLLLLRQSGESLGAWASDLWLLIPVVSPPKDVGRTVAVLTAAWCLTAVAGVWGATKVVDVMSAASTKSFRQQVAHYMRSQKPVSLALEGAPSHGPADAPVTIVEYSDFLCPACQRTVTTTRALLKNYPDDVRFIYKYYPVDKSCNQYLRGAHHGACELAAAATCAQAQGKFWNVHDEIFDGPSKEYAMDVESFIAAQGLDMERWRTCMADPSTQANVLANIEEGHAHGVQSTPTFFINGYIFRGALSPALFTALIEDLRGGQIAADPHTGHAH